MSQGKIPVVILLLIGVLLAVWLRPGNSVVKSEIYSPLSSPSQPSSLPQPPAVSGQGQFLPPAGDSGIPAGAAIGISVPGGNLTDAMRILNSPEMLKAMQEQSERVYGKAAGESFPASGPTTAGSVITIKGHKIKLPDNVEIEAFISNVACQIGLPCLRTPIYVLKNNETGHSIAVSIPTGFVGDPTLPKEELNQLRSEFKWLVEAIEGE